MKWKHITKIINVWRQEWELGPYSGDQISIYIMSDLLMYSLTDAWHVSTLPTYVKFHVNETNE